MENLESKKLALIRILQIFRLHSDFSHPLTQESIASYLERDYGIKIERKAIGRNVSLLREAGFEIESTREGSYLAEREFEDSELRLLIDGILSSKHITAKQSAHIINRLCALSNEYFKSHIKHIYSVNDWGKTGNQALFLNIELIDEAIERKKQLVFDYNKYGIDKKLHKTSAHSASPYQLILHNQRYYLMALNEKYKNLGYYRVDRITNMEISEEAELTDIRTVEGFEKGINYKELAASLPYMYTDKVENVEFIADELIIDQIVDWFGYDAKIHRLSGGKLRVNVPVTPAAMEYWAMQYANYVEITAPLSLREKVGNNLISAARKYSD